MAETNTGVYIMCTSCPHTVNIHNETGCHAYKCTCVVTRTPEKKKKEE